MLLDNVPSGLLISDTLVAGHDNEVVSGSVLVDGVTISNLIPDELGADHSLVDGVAVGHLIFDTLLTVGHLISTSLEAKVEHALVVEVFSGSMLVDNVDVGDLMSDVLTTEYALVNDVVAGHTLVEDVTEGHLMLDELIAALVLVDKVASGRALADKLVGVHVVLDIVVTGHMFVDELEHGRAKNNNFTKCLSKIVSRLKNIKNQKKT